MTLEDIIAGIFGGQGQMQPAPAPSGQTPNDLIMGSLGASGAASPTSSFGIRRADSAPVTQSRLQPVAVPQPPQANPAPAPTSSQGAMPQPSVPDPTFLDRLGAFADGGGKPGGVLGGIVDAFTAPDQAVTAKRQQIQATNLTYRAMIQKGIPEDQAIAIISNPALAKEVLPKIFAPAEATKPTDEMREYDFAMGQLPGGTPKPSFTDWKTGLKKAGAPSTNIDMKQEGAYDKELGGTLAKEFVAAQASGATAQRDLGNLAVMKSAMADPNLYTGTGGQAVNSLKRGAQTLFGVDVKGVSSAEVVGNLASEIAVGNKQKLPGPMSDADRNFLVDMAPNLTKSPEGNRLIIELGMASKRWEIARAQLFRDYAAKNGGRLDAGAYAAQAELDNATAAQMGDVIGKLRQIGETAPRAPTTGTPLPQGWSIEKVQ